MELERVLSLMAIYFVWVLVPMIPSIVIYRLFPDTAVAVSGVLAGLTVRATGAFAAYLLLFLVAHPLINQIVGDLDPEQVWTIQGDIKLEDQNGREIKNSGLVNKLSVELNPNEHDISENGFRLRVVKRDNQLPYVTIRIPNWGGGNIDTTHIPAIAKIDDAEHIIQLSEPVVIQRDLTTRDLTRPSGQ